MSGRRLVVCWFDPGITTGWCLLRVPEKRLLDEGQVGARRWMQWSAGQFGYEGDTSANVDRALNIARVAYTEVADVGDVWVLGAEGFTLRMLSMDSDLLEPVRWLAVMRDRLRGTGQGLEIQGSSDALTTITDHRLTSWDLHHRSEHARAATKHALLFCRRWVKYRQVRDSAGREVEGDDDGDQ